MTGKLKIYINNKPSYINHKVNGKVIKETIIAYTY